MAHLIVDFYADALGVETRMHVLLPQRLTGRAKTLYLLHGMSDDEGTWMRRTAIDRYAEEKDLAVVMPDGGLGWYTDMRRGLPWFTFVSKELPALCRRFFPILSSRREDTYIGGLSMGGYGALKCGLRAPETFSKVISLSGALDAADTAINNTVPATRRYWEDVFGPSGRARLGKRPLCRRHGAGRSRPAAQNLHVVRHGRLSLRPEHAHARSSARAGLRPDL